MPAELPLLGGRRMASSPTAVSSNRYMEGELRGRCLSLAQHVKADVITYIGPIYPPVDDLMRVAVEQTTNRKARLCVLLETDGGTIEVAERIANTFRHFYSELWFVVPNYAMSAGTVLVMCGDRIFMDYYSTLGPIDPQVGSISGGLVPALGYLAKYEELVDKSNKGTLSTAELAYLIERFDPAELYSYEQARDLSVDLLEEWLVKWKFKDWNFTETRKKKVTPSMKKTRAQQIAKILNSTDKWKSHGRGLSMEAIRRDLNLKIDDIEDDAELNTRTGAYYHLLKDYMQRRAHEILIHTPQQYVGMGASQ